MEADTGMVLVVHRWMVGNLMEHYGMLANLMVHQWVVSNCVVGHCWMVINLVVEGRAVDSQSVERGWLGRRLDGVDCLKSIWGMCQCHGALRRLRISEIDRHMVDV